MHRGIDILRLGTIVLAAVIAGMSCRCNDTDALELPPATPSTLSLLTPHGMKCQWIRFDPLANDRRIIAELDVPCVGGATTWSYSGRRGLVWFDYMKAEGATGFVRGIPDGFVKPEVTPPVGLAPRLFVIEIGKAASMPLPVPPAGTIARLGFDTKDRVVALTEAPARVSEDGETVVVDGLTMKVDRDREGLPLVVRSFVWERDAWSRTESQLSDTGWDFARGVGALAVVTELTKSSREILTPHPSGRPIEDPALLKRLLRHAPALAASEGQWLELAAAEEIYVWELNIEFVYATGLILFGKGAELSPPAGLDFTAGDLVAPDANGSYLLVAANESGTHPRLYDLATRKPVYKSDIDRAAVFWPVSPPAQ